MSGKKKNRNGNGAKKGDIPLEVEEIAQSDKGEEMNEETKEEKGNVNVAVNTKEEAGKETKENIKTKISGNGIVAIIIVIACLISGLVAFGLWSWGPKKEVAAAETTITTEAAVNSEELEIIEKAVQSGVEKAVEEAKKVTETTAAAETTTETTETTPETTAVTETTAEEKTIEAEEKFEATGAFSMGWEKDWRMSTVPKTKSLQDEKTWEFFNEPGVFPGYDGRQVAWDKMEYLPSSINVPHDAGTYISGAHMSLLLKQDNIPIINLPYKEGLNYLVFLRGLPLPEGELGEHYNRTVVASEYPKGHVINSLMPEGAYFSLDWTLDQVDNCFEELKCNKVIVVAIDLETQTIRAWKVIGPDNDDWQRNF